MKAKRTDKFHGVRDLWRQPFRYAVVEDLALPAQVVERNQRLLDRCCDVEAMALVQVNIINVEALQGGMTLFKDVLSREA